MEDSKISQIRMQSQKLLENRPYAAEELVSHMGAMQAQDLTMAKWAIGSRTTTTENEIQDALNSFRIIRTHILRPTWHLVAAEDIHWMLDLSAPQVKKFTTSLAKKYGFDEKKLDQTNAAIEKLLAGNVHLTRNEIMQELNIKKNTEHGFLGATLMMNAELDGLVCNGHVKGKQMTYTLLEEHIAKPSSKLNPEEALRKLAKRYFESHGPATLQDFSWWSGFSPTLCKQVLHSLTADLNFIKVNHQTFWFGTSLTDQNQSSQSIHFLPAFDEILIAYKSREASISLEHQPKAFTNNGIFKPIILENGKVIGTWKKTSKKDATQIETCFFTEKTNSEKDILFKGINILENYLQTKITIE